jgi:hypothetical protein
MTAVARARAILTWRHWAWATAIPILVAVSMPLQSFEVNRYWALWQVLFTTPWYLSIAYLFLGAIVLAESSVRGVAITPVWRYVAAITAASAICLGISGAFYEYFPTPPRIIAAGQTLGNRIAPSPAPQPLSPRARRMVATMNPLLSAWLATFVYVGLRKSRFAARALAQAEVGRSEAQRSLAAAQLVAAHAQVDPAFVLQTLESIEQGYEANPAKADAQLDELIDFLRAAIPRLRAEAIGAPA